MAFWVISLVFWYGSRLVADTEYSTKQFFICLMVSLVVNPLFWFIDLYGYVCVS